MRILHLIDSLDYHASARQVTLLAPELARTGHGVEVACLGGESPWAAQLRQAGIPVHVLGWTRWFDFGALLYLRDLLRHERFDVIHVWRTTALRALAVVAAKQLPRVVMSSPLPSKANLAWWDRQLLAKVRRVTVAGAYDVDRCASGGIRALLVPPVLPRMCQPRTQDPFSKKGPDTFVISCVGRLEHDEGFRQAVWAFDFVRHLFPQTRLRLVGGGSQYAALRRLRTGLSNEAIVDLPGQPADATEVFANSDLVWIPMQIDGGRQLALEAMAQGRCVVASDVPSLREVIQHGQTGFLTPPHAVLDFARRTKTLIENAELREQVGNNACRFVEAHYGLADIVCRWQEIYAGAA